VRYNTEHSVFLVENFIRRKKFVNFVESIWVHLSSANSSVLKLYKEWNETGSTADRKGPQSKHVLTQEAL
jgi:hypothetical protein